MLIIREKARFVLCHVDTPIGHPGVSMKYKSTLTTHFFCHVRCKAAPSMKQGAYKVYILLAREGNFAAIRFASCECAAA